MDAAIAAASRMLDEVAAQYRNNPLHSAKGFLAEAFHVGTFNVDAVRRGLNHVRAERVGGNGHVDARVHVGDQSLDYQIKYYRDAGETAKALSDPHYDGMWKLAPSDQVGGVRAEAMARAARIEGHRPEQAAHLRDTADHVSGRLEGGGARSHALDHDDAVRLAREGQRGESNLSGHGVSIDRVIEPLDVAREAAKAGLSAVAISAAIASAPHVIATLRSVYEGDRDRAIRSLKAAAREGVHGGGAGFLRGAVASGVQVMCRIGALGEAARSATPGAVGAVTAMVLRAMVDAYRLSRGEITPTEFGDRTAGGCAAGVAGMYGAAVGQAVIPIPVVGALVGSFVGSLLGSAGYDGLKSGVRRAENREAWEAQVALVSQIAAVGEALQITADGAVKLVMAQDALAQRFAINAQEWQVQSARMNAEIARIEARHRDFDERHQAVNARLAVLQARLKQPS
ncbi:MAG: hypothetical protein R3A52_02220 [Polyangiales bacterium]